MFVGVLHNFGKKMAGYADLSKMILLVSKNHMN